MVDEGEMVKVTDAESLEKQIEIWANSSIADRDKPIGVLLMLGGADSAVQVSNFQDSYAYVLRGLGRAE
jgi:hypothetical protein